MLFNIFMRQTLTNYFWGLHKNMNSAFPLKFLQNSYEAPVLVSFFKEVAGLQPKKKGDSNKSAFLDSSTGAFYEFSKKPSLQNTFGRLCFQCSYENTRYLLTKRHFTIYAEIDFRGQKFLLNLFSPVLKTVKFCVFGVKSKK